MTPVRYLKEGVHGWTNQAPLLKFKGNRTCELLVESLFRERKEWQGSILSVLGDLMPEKRMNWRSGLFKVSSSKSALLCQRQTHQVFLLSSPDTYRARVARSCWSMNNKEGKGIFMIKTLKDLVRSHDAVGRHSSFGGVEAKTNTTSHVDEQQKTGSALSVAIVGAGAAGLITARELRKMGHQVTVFEQTNSIGGVWSYTDEVEDDILGTDPDRKKVHGSMYANLRTNLPREVMGVADFPFDDQFPGSRDFRRYCSHEEVFRYLVAYAEQYSVNQSIKLNAKVIDLKPLDDGSGSWPKWQVKVSMENAVEKSSTFDACVICNGHYSKPRVPQWPGQEEFPGIQMHSHNYRRPEKFKGKRVLVVGAAFSGSDISQELLEYGAKAVYLSGRSWEDLAKGQMLENSREVLRVNNIERLHEDGSVSFIDGTRVDDVDVIMYATGYLYEFPFLSNVPDAPSVKDNRVSVLYKHVFPPRLGPTLSFVGLPWKVVPFPQFQLQAQWIGACLNGSVQLPCADDMTQDALQWYQSLDRQGIETRYTHRMSPDLQAEYNTWLAETSQVSQAGWPDWRKELYLVSGMNRRQHGTTFREHDLEQLGAAHAIEQFRQEAKQVRQSLISPYTAMSNAS